MTSTVARLPELVPPPGRSADPRRRSCGRRCGSSSPPSGPPGRGHRGRTCGCRAWDERFTKELGERGWLGMTIPVEYGGHGASPLERYVVTEELLAAGAPVAAHWVADRQIGPTLLRFGTEEQRQAFLPGIAAGEVYFGIGMSEPDSGSDLASVRTKAREGRRRVGAQRHQGLDVRTRTARTTRSSPCRTAPPRRRRTATRASRSSSSSCRARA